MVVFSEHFDDPLLILAGTSVPGGLRGFLNNIEQGSRQFFVHPSLGEGIQHKEGIKRSRNHSPGAEDFWFKAVFVH